MSEDHFPKTARELVDRAIDHQLARFEAKRAERCSLSADALENGATSEPARDARDSEQPPCARQRDTR
jgi:hypothetical protein